MTVDEKFKKIEEFFWNNFFYELDNNNTVSNNSGSNIPYQLIIFNQGRSHYCDVGDGTINLAGLWTLLWMKEKLSIESPINLVHALEVYDRLVAAAYINCSFDNWYVDEQGVVDGFFLRDDILGDGNIKSNLRMLHYKELEDPCRSPFVSQDQIWNMNPILAKLASEGNEKAKRIGLDINSYIQNNGYTIYNPYLSALVHFYTYLPTFNENKVKAWERQQDRDNHYIPNIKVKRGANNWYYSGGTKAAVKFFFNTSPTGGLTFNSLREIIYKSIVFVLDRIYEPIYRLITNSDFKHNSYYCYAATSGIWYNRNYKERFTKRFNVSLKDANNEAFEANIAPIVLDDSAVDINSLVYYLDIRGKSYCDTIDRINNDVHGTIQFPSPLNDLLLYYLYKRIQASQIPTL